MSKFSWGAVLVAGVLFFFYPLTQADWPKPSLVMAEAFSDRDVKPPDGLIATAWAAFHINKYPSTPVESWRLPSPAFHQGTFEVMAKMQYVDNLDHDEDDDREDIQFDPQSLKTAPLLIFLPGIFADIHDPSARRAIGVYHQLGYHVVITDNSWGARFIKERPNFIVGDIRREARFVLDFISASIAKIGKKNIVRVELVGESYGAMLAGIAFALDQQNHHPMIDGNVTLFSPPEDLRYAVAQLDRGFLGSTHSVPACGDLGSLLKIIDGLLGGIFTAEKSHRAEACAGPLVYESFHQNIIKTARTLHAVNHVGFIPSDGDQEAAWERNLTFLKMIDDFYPESDKQLLLDQSSLVLWLDQLPTQALRRLRILTTKDDFLNIGRPWPTGRHPSLSRKILIQLKWGGHLGYESLPNYHRFLQTAFGDK